MKKVILLLTAFVCFQLAVHSQTRIGITGGISVGSMEGAGFFYGGTLTKWGGDVVASGKSGFITGLVLETPIWKSFAFRPTLSYVQKVTSQPPPGLADKLYIGLRYIEFNTDFLYYLEGNQKGGFFIGAGPSIAFDMPSKKVSVTDKVKTASVIKFGEEYGNDIKGFDYGANYTMGWRMKNGFLISLNYNRGHRNLVPAGSPAYPQALENSGSIKNRYFGIQMGFFLNNGGDK
jgi:hypothetical protein